jgi:hypothetical protein
MVQYFAMIDDERRGPYRLEELVDAGVRPDTYIWYKGMDDWEMARYDADICRMFRQRIFAINHPEPVATTPVEEVKEEDTPQIEYREPTIDNTQQPISLIFLSFLLTFFCFPFTGIVAIYYSIKTRQAWEEATRSNSDGQGKLYTDEERNQLRTVAHDYSRLAKMWVGITLFLGLIVYAIVGKSIV